MLLSFCHHSRVLLALVTILAQSLLTLVGSHLVTLLFLSVWHNFNFLLIINSILYILVLLFSDVLLVVVLNFSLHACCEALCRLECRQVVCLNHDCGVL